MSTATRPHSSSSPAEDSSTQPAPFSDLLTPRGAIPTPFPFEWVPFSAPAALPPASKAAYTTSALPSPLLATTSSPSALPYLSIHPSTATITYLSSSEAPSIDSFPADYPFLAKPWEGAAAPRFSPSSLDPREGTERSKDRKKTSSTSPTRSKALRRLSSAILRPRKHGEQFGAEGEAQRGQEGEMGSNRSSRGEVGKYIELPEEAEIRNGGQWERQVQEWESAERAKGFETAEQIVEVDRGTADALRMMGL